MENWKQYIFSLFICALSCGILTQIISDPTKKALMHVVSGTVLAISILHPLSSINLEDYLCVSIPQQYSADSYIEEGKKTASEYQARCIKVSCETYILNKAKSLGAEISAQISLNHDLIPIFVEISGEADHNVQIQLQNILTTDLGIPKENQKWIWNQESNSS